MSCFKSTSVIIHIPGSYWLSVCMYVFYPQLTDVLTILLLLFTWCIVSNEYCCYCDVLVYIYFIDSFLCNVYIYYIMQKSRRSRVDGHNHIQSHTFWCDIRLCTIVIYYSTQNTTKPQLLSSTNSMYKGVSIKSCTLYRSVLFCSRRS